MLRGSSWRGPSVHAFRLWSRLFGTEAVRRVDLSSIGKGCGHTVEDTPQGKVLLWRHPPHTVLAVRRRGDDFVRQALDTIASWATTNLGWRVLVEPGVALEHPTLETYDSSQQAHLTRSVDLVLTLGGDGTIIHTARLFKAQVPPVVSFSLGTLGFLMPFSVKNFEGMLMQVAEGGFSITERMRLSCEFHVKHSLTIHPVQSALNEVVLHRGGEAQLVRIDAFVEDSFLTHSMGDGLVVATPTGSTAYSLSAGGPMLHPSTNTVVMTPISPMSLSFRPIVLPERVIIRLVVSDSSRSAALASVDGRPSVTLGSGDSIVISRSPYPVPTVNRENVTSDWVEDINNLLRWNIKAKQFARRD